MSIDIILFLELDSFINEHYDSMTDEEYQTYVKILEGYKDVIIGE